MTVLGQTIISHPILLYAWLNEEDKLSTWDQAGKFTKYNQNELIFCLFILVMLFKSNLEMLHAKMTACMHACLHMCATFEKGISNIVKTFTSLF